MFYIIEEFHSIGGSCDMKYSSWNEYTIQVDRPSSKVASVKVDMTKEQLKDQVAKRSGDLQETLKYLFQVTEANEDIDRCFD